MTQPFSFKFLKIQGAVDQEAYRLSGIINTKVMLYTPIQQITSSIPIRFGIQVLILFKKIALALGGHTGLER